VGVPGFSAVAWLALAAPGETPAPVVDKLFGEVKAVLNAPEMRELIGKMGLSPMDNPSLPELRAFVRSEIARWGEVVKASGASAE
jgi:tripartite-type tricarboxylate transporter receptor subunit TctC